MTDEEPGPDGQLAANHPLQDVIKNPALPRLYANGFTLGVTNADAYIILQEFGKPVAVLNLSYTLAKTLSLRHGRMMAEWETRLEQSVATTDKIDAAFTKPLSDAGETKQ
jgi:hypothetical protein